MNYRKPVIFLATALSLAIAACETDRSTNRYSSDQNQLSREDNVIYGYTSPVQRETRERQTDQRTVTSIVANWPEVSRKAADQIIQKYGQPNGVTETMLVWKNNGPWICTIVYRDPIKHSFPMEHEDCLEQFINYRVPVDKFDELAQYDGSVICERTAGWMSARCDKEAMNFLALNLAHDIITGKKTVDEARQAYAKAAMAFKDGEIPSETQELLFEVKSTGTGDPDTPVKVNR